MRRLTKVAISFVMIAVVFLVLFIVAYVLVEIEKGF